MTSDLSRGMKERDWNCSVPGSFRFYSRGEVGTGVALVRVSPEKVGLFGIFFWVRE